MPTDRRLPRTVKARLGQMLADLRTLPGGAAGSLTRVPDDYDGLRYIDSDDGTTPAYLPIPSESRVGALLASGLATRISLATIYPDIDLTGQTVEHTRLQNALNRMRDYYGGGTLTLPRGRLLVDPHLGGQPAPGGLPTIFIPDGVNVEGAGKKDTILALRPDTEVSQSGGGGYRQLLVIGSDSRVSGIGFDGQRSLIPSGRTYGVIGVRFGAGSQRSVVEGCNFYEIGAAAGVESFGVAMRPNVVSPVLRDCHAWNVTGSGFSLDGSLGAAMDAKRTTSPVMEGCTAHDCTWMGVTNFWTLYATLRGVTAWNNGQNGINTEYSDYTAVENCRAWGNTQSGIFFGGPCRSPRAVGSVAYGNNVGNLAYHGGIVFGLLGPFSIGTRFTDPTVQGQPVGGTVEGCEAWGNGYADYLEYQGQRPYSPLAGNAAQTTAPYGYLNGWGYRADRNHWIYNSVRHVQDDGTVVPSLYRIDGTNSTVLAAGGEAAQQQLVNGGLLFNGTALAGGGVWTLGGGAAVAEVADTAALGGLAARLTYGAGGYSQLRQNITVPGHVTRVLLRARLRGPNVGTSGVVLSLTEAAGAQRTVGQLRLLTGNAGEQVQAQDVLADWRVYTLALDLSNPALPSDLSRNLRVVLGSINNGAAGTETLDVDWVGLWFEYSGGRFELPVIDPGVARRDGENVYDGAQTVRQTSTENGSRATLRLLHSGAVAGGQDLQAIVERVDATNSRFYLRWIKSSGFSDLIKLYLPGGGADLDFGGNVSFKNLLAVEGNFYTNNRLYVSKALIRVPSAAQTLVAGTVITAAASVSQVTAASAITLTSAPHLADGLDGQMVRVLNVGSAAITLQDQGTLAGSNVRLTAATVAIGPRQSIELMFSSTVGDWVQVGGLVAVL